MRLPKEKVDELVQLLASWCSRRHGTKRELETLAGKLQHACRVVRPGRCFMRRLYALSSGGGRRYRLVRLNKETRADISWWHAWLAEWNGVSLLWSCRKSEPDEEVWSETQPEH